MTEEAKIKDSKIISDKEKKQENPHIEKVLILILGILIGIALKTEALEKITIGFDDYLMTSYEQSYDLNKMEDEQIKKMIEEQKILEEEVEENY